MALEGKIVTHAQALHVVTSWMISNEPIERRTYWKIEALRADAYGFSRPEDGDLVRYSGDGYWSVLNRSGGGVYTGPGNTEAAFIEEVPVPAPPARGKDLRWKDGRWEKCLKKGWVPA